MARIDDVLGLGGAASKAAPKGARTAPAAAPKRSALDAALGIGAVAPSAQPKNKQNFLVKALNVLDKPGAAIRNTVFEGIDAAQGKGEFSLRDIGQGISSNKSTAQYLTESGSTLPGWAKVGLGFVGDVAMDPLTYLGGAGVLKAGGQTAARQLLDPKIISALAAKNITPEAAASAAKTLVSGGAGRVDPKVLQALGEVTGKTGRSGIYFRPTGTKIPGSERLARAAANINADARKAFLNTKAGESIAKRLGGKAGEAGLTKRIRNGDFSAFHELENMKFMDRTRKLAETTMLTQLDQILKPFKGDTETLTDMRRALEGDDVALLRMESRGMGQNVADVAKWLDDAGTRAGLPKIENYFPRQWSKELRDELQSSMRSGSKEIGPAMKRELVDGTEWMGHTLRGTAAEIRDQIEDIARSVHGPKYKQVFSDSVPDVLSAYASQIARREANLAAQDDLLRRLGPKTAEAAPSPASGLNDISAPGGAASVARTAPVPEAADDAARLKPTAPAPVRNEAAILERQLDGVTRRVMDARSALLADRERLLASATGGGVSPEVLAAQKTITDAEAGMRALRQLPPAQRPKALYRMQELQTQIDEARALLDNTPGAVDNSAALREIDRKLAGLPVPDVYDTAVVVGRDPRLIDEVAEAQQRMFPADTKSVGAIRQAVAKPEELQEVLTGSARKLADGRNVGEVVDVLQSIGRITGSGNNGLLKWYDKANQILKQYMIFSPGFHIRNAMGGEFNNFVAGVSIRNRQKWHSIWRKSRFGANPDRLSKADRAIFDQVTATGTFNQTQAQDVVGAMRSGVSANPLAQNFAPVKASYQVSGAVEGYLRGSVAYDVIAKGGSVDDAADAVIKFHYDYDDLSGFERGVMKRIIPFYTWTRKNLPLQLEQMVKQPAKYSAYVKAKNNIESQSPEEGVVPGFFGDLGSIRMPWSIGEGQAYWSPDLPFRDVSEYVRPDEPLRGVGMLIGAATPIIKLPVERWAGKKYFTDSPFFPGDSPAPGSWSAIPGLMPALAAIGMADRGADGGYYMDQRNVYSVEQVVPVLARIHRLAPSGEGDEYMKQRQATNVLSFFGLGVQSNTPEAQKAELKKRQAALKKAAKKAKDLGYVQ